MTNSVENIEDRVREIAEAAIPAGPLFLVRVDVRGRTGSRVVSVFIDGDEPPELDALAGISRDIEARLDEADFIRGGYRLEASTPGAAEPLLHPRQYEKHIGRTLEVLTAGADSAARGTLVSADSGQIELDDNGQRTTFTLDSIERATVQLPW